MCPSHALSESRLVRVMPCPSHVLSESHTACGDAGRAVARAGVGGADARAARRGGGRSPVRGVIYIYIYIYIVLQVM